MGATYAYGLIKNHPFVDGNKRIGMICAMVFFEFNNIVVELTEDEFYDLGIRIASSQMIQDELSVFFRDRFR